MQNTGIIQIIAIISCILVPSTATATPACKLFPKIIGGSAGPTYLYTMDANTAKDIIAVGG